MRFSNRQPSFLDENFHLTCLYTELAKSYFLLGPIMSEENICKCTPIEVCDECHKLGPPYLFCEAWQEEEE